jgi:hypothetical protein
MRKLSFMGQPTGQAAKRRTLTRDNRSTLSARSYEKLWYRNLF